MEIKRGSNEDVQFDFGKNIKFLQDDSKVGDIVMNDDGGEMDIEFEAIKWMWSCMDLFDDLIILTTFAV